MSSTSGVSVPLGAPGSGTPVPLGAPGSGTPVPLGAPGSGTGAPVALTPIVATGPTIEQKNLATKYVSEEIYTNYDEALKNIIELDEINIKLKEQKKIQEENIKEITEIKNKIKLSGQTAELKGKLTESEKKKKQK